MLQSSGAKPADATRAATAATPLLSHAVTHGAEAVLGTLRSWGNVAKWGLGLGFNAWSLVCHIFSYHTSYNKAYDFVTDKADDDCAIGKFVPPTQREASWVAEAFTAPAMSWMYTLPVTTAEVCFGFNLMDSAFTKEGITTAERVKRFVAGAAMIGWIVPQGLLIGMFGNWGGHYAAFTYDTYVSELAKDFCVGDGTYPIVDRAYSTPQLSTAAKIGAAAATGAVLLTAAGVGLFYRRVQNVKARIAEAMSNTSPDDVAEAAVGSSRPAADQARTGAVPQA